MLRTTALSVVLLSAAFALNGRSVAAAHEPTPLAVPGDELVVIDPHVDSEGKPRPMLVPDDPESRKHVEIAPVLIVHRFYYTGDRDFQGPMLPGGPTIIIGTHPVSGEQFSVQVQMLPGAPRVYYRKDHICYDYLDTTITLHFGHLTKLGFECEPHVVIHNCGPFRRQARDVAKQCKEHTRSWVERTGIPHAVEHVHSGAVGALDKTADTIHDAGQFVAAPVQQLWESTPLKSLVVDTAEERATRERDAAVQRVTGYSDRLAETIKTLR